MAWYGRPVVVDQRIPAWPANDVGAVLEARLGRRRGSSRMRVVLGCLTAVVDLVLDRASVMVFLPCCSV